MQNIICYEPYPGKGGGGRSSPNTIPKFLRIFNEIFGYVHYSFSAKNPEHHPNDLLDNVTFLLSTNQKPGKNLHNMKDTRTTPERTEK